MILVDTSVWIDHIRTNNEKLLAILAQGLVLHHPFVTAELALGSIPDRVGFCAMLGRLPRIEPVDTDGLLEFVTLQKLYGTGIGMVDAHLLAAASRRKETFLWAIDRRLTAQAERLGLAHSF